MEPIPEMMAANVLTASNEVRLLLDLSREQVAAGSVSVRTPPGVFSVSSTIFVTQMQLKI